ncbi:glycoside hydrolase family 19 protein [Novosphingobium guangzhouense]|uniref:Glycoside hydrolase family 19 n=1 Tax=Novosphingobium guangzhouense TaxID=1850347 RepID=A0A2K2G365_9SPHN|nr:glycoside hydrolase family 19 protein [Novosphingobium guangzhouense]PNU05474.1 hypothetical protein A8V01_15935 [Novosphingobium guangzhouense]
MLTDTILRQAFPTMTAATRKMVLAHAPAAMERFQINTPRRVAAFLAQCAHESAMFTANKENLNYSWQALLSTFGERHFPSVGLAKQYARKPVAIANRVYANRMGNGPEKSGDGAKFAGKGWLQITGRNNVTALAMEIGKTVDETLAYLLTDEGGFIGACWFWRTNRLNVLADGWQITNISKRINGGTNGLEERIAYSNALRRALEAAA